jgi:starch-binding outer membrane protein, SusD/RagB family
MKKITLLLATTFFIYSCHNDLDQVPIDPDLFTEVQVYENSDQALGALTKVYASLALTGQIGPAGDPDIDPSLIDEGFSQYTRILFTLNEITTDNAVVGWGDPGLPNIHEMSWDVNNPWTQGMYFRLAQVVSFSNSFIENAQLLSETDSEVKAYIAEARFLRAYAYLQLMDLYNNVPLVTKVTTELPVQSSPIEIFSFVESELKEIDTNLKDSKSNQYGRVDKAAAWSLLSRLYLNAPVYINADKSIEVIEYSEKVINSGYAINTSDINQNGSAYDELFLADNNINGAQNEFIFVVQFDGINSQSWGGSTFMVHAPIGGSMDPTDFGVNGGWAGLRTTKGLVDKFSYSVTGTDSDNAPVSWSDSRAMFHTDGQNYEIEKIPKFTEGYAVTKFKNITANGSPGSDSSGDHVDLDLPIIRLAEVYLNYAEAVVNNGGGSLQKATELINTLRNRSGAPLITSSELTPEFILDERSRELYWEGHRRTDLIRHGKYVTSAYLWPFKAGAAQGKATESHRKIFPLPENVLLVNKNLTQNPNY